MVITGGAEGAQEAGQLPWLPVRLVIGLGFFFLIGVFFVWMIWGIYEDRGVSVRLWVCDGLAPAAHTHI